MEINKTPKRIASTTSSGYLNRIWRLFSSIRLALALMLILTAVSLAGTFIIQSPPEIRSDPATYTAWVDSVAREKFGILTPVMNFAGLFDVFHSFWFLGAGALLMLNILVCTTSRVKSNWLSFPGKSVVKPVNFYQSGDNCIQLTSTNQAIDGVLSVQSKFLQKHKYRVRTEITADHAYLSADKNRYFRLGTIVSHLSLILFILGFLIGTYFGFRDTSFIVVEDSLREVGHDTGLSLKLESFTEEYWEDGLPKDYRSQVVLYDQENEVRKATVRVNYPLEYKGTRFYQSFFGPAVWIQIRDGNGQLIYENGVPLTGGVENDAYLYRLGDINLPEQKVRVRLIRPAGNGDSPLIKAGELGIAVSSGNPLEPAKSAILQPEKPATINNLQFTFIKAGQYSGFQVSRDPGNLLIWLASGLFIVGTGMMLYFPYRQIWALSIRQGKQTQIWIRASGPRVLNLKPELQNMADEIANEIKIDD